MRVSRNDSLVSSSVIRTLASSRARMKNARALSTLANRLCCRSQGIPYPLKRGPHSGAVIPGIGGKNGNHQSTIEIDVQAVAVRTQKGDAVLRSAKVDKAVAEFAAFFQAGEIRSVCCRAAGGGGQR